MKGCAKEVSFECGHAIGSRPQTQKLETACLHNIQLHRFSVPDLCVFPPPGGRFSAPTTENRIYNWATQAAQQ